MATGRNHDFEAIFDSKNEFLEEYTHHLALQFEETGLAVPKHFQPWNISHNKILPNINPGILCWVYPYPPHPLPRKTGEPMRRSIRHHWLFHGNFDLPKNAITCVLAILKQSCSYNNFNQISKISKNNSNPYTTAVTYLQIDMKSETSSSKTLFGTFLCRLSSHADRVGLKHRDHRATVDLLVFVFFRYPVLK